jgi:hypothetical protein
LFELSKAYAGFVARIRSRAANEKGHAILHCVTLIFESELAPGQRAI